MLARIDARRRDPSREPASRAPRGSHRALAHPYVSARETSETNSPNSSWRAARRNFAYHSICDSAEPVSANQVTAKSFSQRVGFPIAKVAGRSRPEDGHIRTHRVDTMAAITSAASAVVARPAFVGKTESLRARAVAPAAPKRASVVTFASAEETSRRAALSTFTVSARTPIPPDSFHKGISRRTRASNSPLRRRAHACGRRPTSLSREKQTLRNATATRALSRRAIGTRFDTLADRSTFDSSPNLRPPVSRSPRSPPWPRMATPPTSGVPPPTPPVRPRETQKVTTGTSARHSRSVRVG